MRRIARLTLALAIALPAGMALPPAAQAQDSPEPDPLIICDYLVSEGFFRNFGQCVSGFRADAKFCTDLDKETLELIGFRNRGECVAFIVRNRQN